MIKLQQTHSSTTRCKVVPDIERYTLSATAIKVWQDSK
jgi:hypothetical protein